MLGQSGQEVQATSLVFTPNTPQPVGGWPIVVWAHGTTGWQMLVHQVKQL